MGARLSNSSMATIADKWCRAYANNSAYVIVVKIAGQLIDVHRKCRQNHHCLELSKNRKIRRLFWRIYIFFCLEIMWPVSMHLDMVRHKAHETTSKENLVDFEQDPLDTSLKSDTAQQIIQQWIEVCMFSTSDYGYHFSRDIFRSVRFFPSGALGFIAPKGLLQFTNQLFNFIQEATGRLFHSSRFIDSLQDGVLLC